MKKNIACLTGAGISAESGLDTFRGAGGLWHGHKVEEVATPEAWARNPALVNAFYNARRRALKQVQPNAAHQALASLASDCDIQIITQNVDNLHERGGSKQVLHLHGRLDEVRSQVDPSCIVKWTEDLGLEDTCPHGQPWRPHIVWFGEAVPAMLEAVPIVRDADLLIIIGTSLQVYPAAGLIHEIGHDAPIIYIDPHPALIHERRIHVIAKKATEAIDDMYAAIYDLI